MAMRRAFTSGACPFMYVRIANRQQEEKCDHFEDALRRCQGSQGDLVVDDPEPERQGNDLHEGSVRQHIPAAGEDRPRNGHQEETGGDEADHDLRPTRDRGTRGKELKDEPGKRDPHQGKGRHL